MQLDLLHLQEVTNRQYKDTVLIYKCMNNLVPSYLYNKFTIKEAKFMIASQEIVMTLILQSIVHQLANEHLDIERQKSGIH